MGRHAKTLRVTREEQRELARWLRRRQMPAAEQVRARIVLLSQEGLSAQTIGERTGVSAETVGKWRARFKALRIAGLSDAPRSGRPRSISDEKVHEVIDKTL